jgi:uncharacterized membrane protein
MSLRRNLSKRHLSARVRSYGRVLASVKRKREWSGDHNLPGGGGGGFGHGGGLGGGPGGLWYAG